MAVTYTPATNFGAKDSLPQNDPDKVIKGSEFTTEFTAIQTAFGLAAPAASPTFTGTVTIASVDINGGAIDGTTIGGTTPAAGTFSSLTATTADINGGTIDGVTIGGSSAGAITGTTITGTSFVSSGDMTFGDNNKAVFGAGSDLQIYHDGSHSYVSDQGTGSLYLQGQGNIELQNSAGTETFALFVNNGKSELYYDNAAKLATTSTGIDVTGNATFDDNGKAIFGAGSDLQIYHDGSNSYIDEQGSGALYIRGSNQLFLQSSTGDNYLVANDGGALNIRYAGSIKLATTATGIDVTGTVTADGLTVNLGSAADVTVDSADGGGIQFNYGGVNQVRIDSASNDGGVYHAPAGKNHTFRTDGLDRLKIASGGDLSLYEDTGTTAKFFWDASAESLGIGTSSPSSLWSQAYKLVVGDGSGNTGMSIYSVSAGNSRIAFVDTTAGTPGLDSGGLITYNHVDDRFAFRVDGADAMHIDSSGNVGIGTSSPSYPLHVVAGSNGHIMAEGSATAAYYLRESGEDITAGGLWRTILTGGKLVFSKNSAAGGDFTSRVDAVTIDSSGNLLVGTTTTIGTTDTTGSGHDFRATGAVLHKRDGGTVQYLNRLTSDGDILDFRKDGTTVGSIGTASGKPIFGIGDAYLFFDNGNNRIYNCDSSGADVDNNTDLGYSSARWDDIYATNGTIQTSDRNEKQDIAELDEAERRVAVAAKGLLRKFRWISSVEEKGDEARIHFGIIAQDLQAAFEAEGLDAGRYAMFIHSTWTDEETGEERSRMGVRYSELLAFIIAAL